MCVSVVVGMLLFSETPSSFSDWYALPGYICGL